MQGRKQLELSSAPRRTSRTSRVERLCTERTVCRGWYTLYGPVGRSNTVVRQLRHTLGIPGYSAALAQAKDVVQKNIQAVPQRSFNCVRRSG